jgi:septal ring-binding cell division protein DamX
MKNKIVFILPVFSLVTACSSMEMPNADTKEWIYPVNSPYDNEFISNDKAVEKTETRPLPKFVKTAEVPQQQVSAKNVDISWVEQQNPNAMTIVVASDSKPMPVGMALTETPKDQRSAALKYEKNGQVQYTGVYGTYSDRESAELALQKLPEKLRSNARIENWSNMQNLHLH